MAARKNAKSTAAPVLADPFRATGAQLRAAAEAGNEAAVAELARRQANKAQVTA